MCASQEEKLKQLLSREELGDRKPSQFLRHLQGLAGPSVPTDFLKTLWTSRLPPNLQTLVATQAGLTLDKVAELADTVNAIAPAVCHVASTNIMPTPSSSDTDNNDVTRQIADLTQQVAALSASFHGGRSSRRQGTSQRRSSSRRFSSERSRRHGSHYCWYHRKFGAAAYRCTQPASCTFKSENPRGDRQ